MNIEYSMPPRCDMCEADGAECYPPDNDHGYTGLCKDCFHIFYEENIHLFQDEFIQAKERLYNGDFT